jgi:hypothetical protein
MRRSRNVEPASGSKPIGANFARIADIHSCRPITAALFVAELQGQQSTAIIGEMRDALIDNWA